MKALKRRKGVTDTALMFIIVTVLFIISLAATLVILKSVNIPILNRFKEMWEFFSGIMNNPILGPALKFVWYVWKGLWGLVTSIT